MKHLIALYRAVSSHATKLLGLIGTALLTADVSGYLEGVKTAALQYLPPALANQISKKIGLALFALVILRGWYTGRKAQQQAAALPPPDPSAKRSFDAAKMLCVVMLLALSASTCIAIAAV